MTAGRDLGSNNGREALWPARELADVLADEKGPAPEALLTFALGRGWLTSEDFNFLMNCREAEPSEKFLKRRVRLNRSILEKAEAVVEGSDQRRWTACPVCKSQVAEDRLRSHLRRIHRLGFLPSEAEAEYVRAVDARKRKVVAAKRRKSMALVGRLLDAAEGGDLAAKEEMGRLRAERGYQHIIAAVRRARAARAARERARPRWSRAPLPFEGKAVPGGAPGLGKRS